MSSLEEYCKTVLKTLGEPIANDPLALCDKEVISKILSDPEAAIKIADAELHVFPFKDVDPCWRRLYTDGSIAYAATVIIENSRALNAPSHPDPDGQDWLSSAVRKLDMALIMTGAPLREPMVEELFSKLESALSSLKSSNIQDRRPTKRRKLAPGSSYPHASLSHENIEDAEKSDEFNTDCAHLPEISHPIPRSSMSLSKFEEHLSSPAPHVILSAMEAWPALHERPWHRPSYLMARTLGGRRLVPIELGRSYTDEGWGQAIVPFKNFMTHHLFGAEDGENIGYLAQHDLFAQIPSLRKDVCLPIFCFTDPPKLQPQTDKKSANVPGEPLLNAWFGPAGTISPLHTDPYHNILCQVVGKKYVRLYAPGESPKMYPRGMEGGINMSNTSQIPVERVEMDSLGIEGEDDDDDDEFPLFEDAKYVETVLEEGECLYIPVGWWHYVRSLTVSFSVSFWWN